jgi:hypothetical protein
MALLEASMRSKSRPFGRLMRPLKNLGSIKGVRVVIAVLDVGELVRDFLADRRCDDLPVRHREYRVIFLSDCVGEEELVGLEATFILGEHSSEPAVAFSLLGELSLEIFDGAFGRANGVELAVSRRLTPWI